MSEECRAGAGRMKPIEIVAAELGLEEKDLEKCGRFVAKVSLARATAPPEKKGKLIMVTAMTPTPAGEGKTTTAIGLADALRILGKKAVVALREPSLGPVFGMKGGATGGGKAHVVPCAEINLHFTGDMHAVSSAHNLLAAMADNRVYFDGSCGRLDAREISWKRVVDMNDRSLRSIITGIGETMKGVALESGFDITAASEVMAILCLSSDLKDLKQRLGSLLLGYSSEGLPDFARDIKAHGAMTALLRDALKPNLVQTLEGTPAFVHGGPFANIAHGTSSVMATRLAIGLADYVITETGFASDLGAEKFFDIVVRTGHVPPPDACVIVATLRALKFHGGVKAEDLMNENGEAVERGFENLQKHIENVRLFGVPAVVVLNKFPGDPEPDIERLAGLIRREGVRFALSDVFGRGGEGGLDLGRETLQAIERDEHHFQFLYPLDLPLEDKVKTVATKIYGASSVAVKAATRKKLLKIEKDGFGGLPVCIAKTQSSLSDDAKLLGRPRDFELTVTDVALRSGAGFVVVLCGDIMTMPGLPRSPDAERIDVTEEGEITGIMG